MSDGRFGIRTAVLFKFSFTLAALGGCVEQSTEPIAEADAGAPDSGPKVHYDSALEPGAWEDMSIEQRAQFMREVMLPSVAPMFRDFDAQRFAAVSCKTCHGGGAKAGDFAMPSPDVPALDSAALKNPGEEVKAIVEFMRNVLKPKVSDLLGKRDNAALKCGACHTSKS